MTLRALPVAGFGGLRLDGEHPVRDDERAAIAAHWAEAHAAQPRLFDGRVLLAEGYDLDDGRLTARYRETSFASFLWWRAQGFPERGLRNIFGAAAVVSSDGAVLLGRMAAHTANAGRIYFPAGTPDLDDVVDGAVDLEGSILRELAEETGLAAPVIRPSATRFVVPAGHLVACIRRFDTDLDAAALEARVAAALAADPGAELDLILLVRSAAELPAAALPYVHAAVVHLLGPGVENAVDREWRPT